MTTTTAPRAESPLTALRPSGGSQNAAIEALFERVKRDEDPAAREALVRHFLPLARKLARRYARSSEPYEDLVQVASLSLVAAIGRFDPARGSRFEAFAIPTILGDLRRYFRDCTWAVHVSRGSQERAREVEEASTELAKRHGRSPSVAEIAQYLESSTEEVLDGLQVALAYKSQSLDAPCPSDDADDGCTVGDSIGSEDERYELIEADVAVAAAVHALSERDRRILHLRFVRELTQAEIAREMGISQMQISRILRWSLAKLRELAGAEDG